MHLQSHRDKSPSKPLGSDVFAVAMQPPLGKDTTSAESSDARILTSSYSAVSAFRRRRYPAAKSGDEDSKLAPTRRRHPNPILTSCVLLFTL